MLGQVLQFAHERAGRYAKSIMTEAITAGDVLLYLQITIAVLIVVILYNFLFVVVDVRRIMSRMNDVTQEVENVILKPIGMVDQVMEGILSYLESQTQESTPTKSKKKSSK